MGYEDMKAEESTCVQIGLPFVWKVSRRWSGYVGCGRSRMMGVGCGLPAWIDEAEQREGGSPARRRHCKEGVKV